MRRFVRGLRSPLMTTVATVAVVAVLGVWAVVSDGYASTRMDLSDGAVWVTNQSESMVGRVNTEVGRLDTVLSVESGSYDLVQDGRDVLVVDRSDNTVRAVDPARAQLDAAVPLPPRAPVVDVRAGRAVIASESTGEVWALPAEELADFTPTRSATVQVGEHGTWSLGVDGRLVTLDEGGRVTVLRPNSSTPTVVVSQLNVGDDPQLAAVGGTWAVLDTGRGALVTERGTVDLGGTPAASSRSVLQAAGDGHAAAIASPSGLVTVDLDDLDVDVRSAADLGEPLPPVRADGCTYAAWQSGAVRSLCGEGPAADGQVTISPGSRLALRTNGDRAVLNDEVSGDVWAVQSDDELIDNWSELSQNDADDDSAVVPEDDPDAALEREQRPPVAQDDDLGVRAGTTSVLPVLLNDYDVNGDLLTIADVDPVPEEFGLVEIGRRQQRLHITTDPDATGSAEFSYTVSDGHGGTDEATVTVSVRAPDENSAPRQVRVTRARVSPGASTHVDALDDWYDPDGDPIYLASATTPSPDSVSYSADGDVTFRDAGGDASDKAVGLVVSDGRQSATGSVVVDVLDDDASSLRAESFAVRAVAGHDESIAPLDHVHGGARSPRLAAVPQIDGASVTPDFDAGTVRFSADAPGEYAVSYSATDGDDTASAVIRVVVVAEPSASTPVTVPHIAVAEGQETVEVDVLAGDYDPAGDVLLVTEVAGIPEGAPLQVQVVDHRVLRITLTGALDAPVRIRYTVTNGHAEAVGTVTVVQTEDHTTRQPPVARDDDVSVRVGDVIDVPVLDNDSHPDGDALRLDPRLVRSVGADGGLLFASGDQLRYLAGDSPGNYSAEYRVVAPDGQWATATVRLNVREADASTNSAPAAKDITARVTAGASVRIPVPLDGIDPDGDSVTLLGQQTAPEKGTIVESGPDWMEYRAGEYASGTDSFDYAVIDALGARAVGTVRIGIASAGQEARGPVAVPDEVMVRPGTVVSVRVLDNDVNPDGGPLRVTEVTPSGNDAAATVRGDLVTVHAPDREGTYGFVYEIADDRGATSENFVTVNVRDDAPLARPTASDTVVGLEDILDRSSIDVDVLSQVFFADGAVHDLVVSTVDGYDDAVSINADKTVHVAIEKQRRIIPIEIARPDDSDVSTYALIRMPGSDDALPQLRTGVDPLTVPSESSVTIDINDYVVAAGGRPVRLTDRRAVSASHSSGSGLVVDDTTLTFTSRAQYFGPASISFEVTDAAPGDDDGRVATLVLPLTVTPRQNQPPSFLGSTIEMEPGSERTIDLGDLTRYPYVSDQSELKYGSDGFGGDGARLSLSGRTATIRVDSTAEVGSAHRARITVNDALSAGSSGVLTIEVVPSTRPRAVPADDTVTVERGTTARVDVLANDEATNPFPDEPLRVVDVRGADRDQLPEGLRVETLQDGAQLSVTADESAQVGTATVTYTVADATNDPSRYATGTVRISVRDRPDPVSRLRVRDLSDRSMTVAWDAPAANNAPIDAYEVTVDDAESGDTLSTRTCASTSCSVHTPGNGPDHAVTVTVTARNAVGDSEPVRLAKPVWTDVPAPAPVGLRAESTDHGLVLSWQKPSSGRASPITSYVVTLGPVRTVVAAKASDPVGTAYHKTVTDPALPNGARVTAVVAARNDVYGDATWNEASVTGVPAGAPLATHAVSATASRDGSGDVTVSAKGAFDDNGQAITGYVVAAAAHGSPAPTCDPSGGTVDGAEVTKAVDTVSAPVTLNVAADAAWSFWVFAFNPQGCAASDAATATPLSPPPAPTSVSVGTPRDDPRDDGLYLPTFESIGNAPSAPSGGSVGYEYRFVDDAIGQFETQPRDIRPGERLDVPAEHRGEPGGVQVRTVVTYADGTRMASGWSATVPAGTAVDARADVTYADGTFTWTGAPAADGYSGVKFVCGYREGAMSTSGSCTPGEYAPARLTVQVTVLQPDDDNVPSHWRQYTMVYDEE